MEMFWVGSSVGLLVGFILGGILAIVSYTINFRSYMGQYDKEKYRGSVDNDGWN